MNKENNIIIPTFLFSKTEYLEIFNINSLLTFNNFINTRLDINVSKNTILRIFMYGIFEYQKSIINNSEITLNIISKVSSFINDTKILKNDEKIKKIYRMILNTKKIEDFELIKNYMKINN
jgi:hypothetical protein